MGFSRAQGNVTPGGFGSAQGSAGHGFSPSQGAEGSSLYYAGSPFLWTKNVAIVGASPTLVGFAVPGTGAYASSTLPTGISLDADTGALTGTPTVEAYFQTFYVTATDTNAVDHVANVSYSTALAPVVAYAGTPFTWTPNVAITPALISSTGGTVSSYAVTSGALPTGVTVHATTGTLSGTPTVETTGSAVVTATGPTGLTDTADVDWSTNPQPLLDSLVDYWNLDEASGNRAGSHAALTLTDNATVTSQATGGPDGGQCAQYTEANSEFLSRASETALQTGDIDWTVACWVYLDSETANRTLMTKGEAAVGDEYLLYYVSASDRISGLIFDASGNSEGVTANTFGAVSSGAWMFCLLQFVTATSTLSIQVNNGAADSAVIILTPAAGTKAFRLGTYGGVFFMDGRMAYAGFWKRILTTDEKTFLYNAGAGRTYAAVAAYGG